MRTLGVLPIKTFARAKQRLAPNVSDALRAELAEAMAGDVIEALSRVSALERVVVVTGDGRARALAQEGGATVLADPDETGQSAATSLAVASLAGDWDRVLLVAGDCPLLDPVELDALLSRPGEFASEVVIVPDRHRSGTNGLLLSPPNAIHPAFGPGSRSRHMELAAEASVACTEAELASLALDVDDASDLEAMRAALADVTDRAPRTRAVLERIAPAPPD